MEIVSIIQLLLTFGVSFVFTALLMPWLIELCCQKGLYDQPNERKHKNSIPRLGGLLFAPAMSIGIVAGYLYLGVSVESSQLPVFRLSTMILMAGLFLIYLIGVLDDLLGLSARVKFAGSWPPRHSCRSAGCTSTISTACSACGKSPFGQVAC